MSCYSSIEHIGILRNFPIACECYDVMPIKSEATEKKVHAKNTPSTVCFVAIVSGVFGKHAWFSWQRFIHPVPIKLRIRHEIYLYIFGFEWMISNISCQTSSLHYNGQRNREFKYSDWFYCCDSECDCYVSIKSNTLAVCCRVFSNNLLLKIALTIDFKRYTLFPLHLYSSCRVVSICKCWYVCVKRLRLLSFWRSEESHDLVSFFCSKLLSTFVNTH